MRWPEIAKIFSRYLFAFSIVLIIPLIVSVHFDYIPGTEHPGYGHSTWAFVKTIVITTFCAGGLYLVGRTAQGKLFRKEGLLLVALIWLLSPLFAALPFVFSQTLKSYSQAYFEATSGLTTAGATILCPKHYESHSKNEIPIEFTVLDTPPAHYSYYGTVKPVRDFTNGQILFEGIEAVPKGLLFWRSFMQWIGGIGVVLVFIAVLPALGMGAKLLFQAEATGIVKDGVAPRIRQTARLTCSIYLALTGLQIVLLEIFNQELSFFDAICIAFSTVSTGGFCVRNSNIASYSSPVVEWIIIIFMFLGSLNFSLYYFLIRKQFRRLKDVELLCYLIICVVFSSVVILNIKNTFVYFLNGSSFDVSYSDAVRLGCFQTISFLSTTGFSIVNYNFWPYLSQMILLMSMFLGGMSGSTSGGLKTIRTYLLFGLFKTKMNSIYRPERISVFHINHQPVTRQMTTMVYAFFFIFIASILLGTFVYLLEGLDLQTAFTLTGSMISNVGLGFRAAGPTESVAFLSSFGLFFSSFLMIIGRLEFFVILLLFMPSFWKNY
ncbi:MAG: TrkH family potassium uptake protein [Parachlamydiales bacterium]|nr:TrkH family potassium uptake protein [Parachlamydiales bacterium]